MGGCRAGLLLFRVQAAWGLNSTVLGESSAVMYCRIAIVLLGLGMLVASPAQARSRQYDRDTLATRPVLLAQKTSLVRSVQRALAQQKIRSLALAAQGRKVRHIVESRGSVEAVSRLSLPVLAAVTATASRRSWGGERDLLVRVRGQGTIPVTLVFSPRGDLVVEQGMALSEKSTTSSASALREGFALGRVRGASRSWKVDELGVVKDALALLSSKEQGAVRGLDFVRASAWLGGARHAGRYRKDRRGVRIMVYDRAFAGDRYGFFGSVRSPRPASSNTILHEVGHALADWPARRAWQQVEKQQRRQKSVYKEYRGAYRSYRHAYSRYRVAVSSGRRELIKKRERFMKKREAEAEALRSRLRAVQAEQRDLNRKYRRIQKRSPVIRDYRRALAGHRGPTRYGRTSIHESFAESFALYRGDPAALKRILPGVHRWFEADGHLNWK